LGHEYIIIKCCDPVLRQSPHQPNSASLICISSVQSNICTDARLRFNLLDDIKAPLFKCCQRWEIIENAVESSSLSAHAQIIWDQKSKPLIRLLTHCGCYRLNTTTGGRVSGLTRRLEFCDKSAFSLLRRPSTWRCPLRRGCCWVQALSARRQQRARSYRLISHAHRVLSSKPAARRCCWRSMEQTDWRPTVPAPLKLRPYGAIQICLLLLLLLLLHRPCSAFMRAASAEAE